jgi:hypothetical protein
MNPYEDADEAGTANIPACGTAQEAPPVMLDAALQLDVADDNFPSEPDITDSDDGLYSPLASPPSLFRRLMRYPHLFYTETAVVPRSNPP